MSEYATIILGLAIWHVATLNGISLYAEKTSGKWIVAPDSVMRSRKHLIGIICLLIATIILLLSLHTSYFVFAIFFVGCLLITDTVMIYKAFK